MTVINPNSVAGINSITVQSGNSLSVHKSNGELIRTLTSSSGVSTFSSVSVGTATTDNSAAKSINIGLGASISQHADNSLSFGTGGDERARITSGGLVGINQNTPTHLLHVDSSSGVADGTATAFFKGRFVRIDGAASSDSPRLNLSLDGTDKASIMLNRTSGVLNLETLTAADIVFDTNSTERLRIDSSGRLLINNTSSTSPDGFDSLIQVNADNHEGSITIGRHTANANGPALLFQKSRSGTATPGTGVVSSGDILGTIRYYGSDGTDRNSYAASISCEIDGTPGGNDMPGRLVFLTTADGSASSTERLRITSAGKVGIGTDNPGQTLHLSAASGDVYNRIDTNVNGGMLVYVQGTQRSVFANDSAFSGTQSDTGIGAKGNLIFRTGTSSYDERARITSAGDLLIGNTLGGAEAINMVGGGGGILISRSESGSPTDGQTLADLGLNSYASGQTCSSADVLIRGQADGAHSGSSAGSALLLFTKPASTGPGSSPTERLRINKSGAIGIAGANYGSAGQVLTSNGSGSAVSWGSAGGIVPITATTVSSETSAVSFTEALTGAFDTYKIYIVMIDGLKFAADDRDLRVRYRTGSNGGTLASGSDYHSMTNGANNADDAFSANSYWRFNYNNISNVTVGSYIKGDFNAIIYFQGFEANRRLRYYGMTSYQSADGADRGQFISGMATDATEATGLEFFSSSGNIALGKFSLFGVNG